MYVIVKLKIPGFHKWSQAPDRVRFLRNLHRHIFEIELWIPVEHDDREIEIILTEERVHQHLKDNYGIGDSIWLDNMSCEMLARELAEAFNADRCIVLEDGNGGAAYVR